MNLTQQKPKIIVTGASGLLGRAVMGTLAKDYDVVGLGFSRAHGSLKKLDLLDPEAVTKFFETEKPNVIVHCAAERRPDVAAKDPDGALKLNVATTEHLANLALRLKALFIYISTDYVFDGAKPPYEVNDLPNPLNFYGKTKFNGEQAIRQVNPSAVILRVPVLYGPVAKPEESAVNILMDIVKNPSNRVDMDNVQIRYPTNVLDVGNVIHQLIEKAVVQKNPAIHGIFHFSATERMTKYDMCKIFGELLAVPIDHINPAGPKPDAAPRPNNAQLSTSAMQKVGIDLTHVNFRDWFRNYLQNTAS
ncbi:hypothetical protein BKA69DRAFT_1127583 [Paraphysoderma sedebokerense]|nr:hypothetical protein BKA69DRAFT_1031641 [Paraphysoderma sedebokerense]KAI9138206.1 hypothetical protein BKA69DRAFT_1127583 [Paraphysoderma sedebokerense]